MKHGLTWKRVFLHGGTDTFIFLFIVLVYYKILHIFQLFLVQYVKWPLVPVITAFIYSSSLFSYLTIFLSLFNLAGTRGASGPRTARPRLQETDRPVSGGVTSSVRTWVSQSRLHSVRSCVKSFFANVFELKFWLNLWMGARGCAAGGANACCAMWALNATRPTAIWRRPRLCFTHRPR